MALEGCQSMFANSLFPTYQNQGRVNVGGGADGGVMLPFWMSGVSLQESDKQSYLPWSHNAHDDPYGFMTRAHSSTQNGKPIDYPESDGDTDLQGLVLNILDEAESHDGYSKGSLPTCNPIWSPKPLKDELLLHFQLEAKTPNNPNFPLNSVSREALNTAWSMDIDFQHSSEQATSQQWHFNVPKGDRDTYTSCTQRLPPGLPAPNIGNAYLSEIQKNKYESASVDKNRGNIKHSNNFPDPSDIFSPQDKTNSAFLHPYFEEHCLQSSAKPISNEHFGAQDINQLVSSFQSFMAGAQGGSSHGDFPNMHRDTVGIHNEDRMFEQWKIAGPATQTRSAPEMQTQKEIVGEIRTVEKERNEVMRNDKIQNAFQGLHGFSPQNTEYFQHPKLFNENVTLPNQYPHKMTMHRENTFLPINTRENQFLNHQDQIQNQIKPQMQKENKKMPMSAFPREGSSMRHVTNCNMRGGDNKQPLSQTFDLFGIVQSQRFDGANSTVSAQNTQQRPPLMYPVNDPRRHSNMNSSHFNSRSSPAYGSGVPDMDMGGVMSHNEFIAYSYVSDAMARRGVSTYPGITSDSMTALMMNEGPMIQLYFYLDECYDQWRCLEKERRRIEAILKKAFLGRKNAAVTNAFLPKTPPNPTRVDLLIVNQMREQVRVANLLERMECLNVPLHINIHTALKRHHMALCITQARRKEEIANMPKQQQQKDYLTYYRDTVFSVIALKDLAATTRRLRTALWCALQVTLPKPVKRQDQHINREDRGRARCPSPFEGYSFYL